MDPISAIIGALGFHVAMRGGEAGQRVVNKGVRNAKKLGREYRDLRESSVDAGDFFGQLFHVSETQERRCADNQHEAPQGEDTNQGGTFVCIHCDRKFSVKSW